MGPPSYMRCVVDRNVDMRRMPVLSLGYQLCNSPFYSVFCIYMLLCLNSFLLKHTHNRKIQFANTIAALVNRAALQQIVGVLPATRTTVIGTFQLAPQATLGDRSRRWGEAARLTVSTTTADGDWHTPLTLGASPYLLVRLVYPGRVSCTQC